MSKTAEELTMEIVCSALSNSQSLTFPQNEEAAKDHGDNVSAFYKAIYKAIRECQNSYD